ncbi:MAG: DUF4386 domain-containing protein [Chloroflexales bacterium]|nr:DUF4386 domain-containing protein [Chloroflexales bacterium]
MDRITPVQRRIAAIILLLAGLLPVLGIVLLPATGWPDSVQGMSASEAFPLVRDNALAFRYGNVAMALAGILFLPAAIYILRVIAGDAAQPTLLMRVAYGFALASGALRSLWYAVSLTTTPVLDRLWQGADPATQASINVFYIAINDLLSTVQEDIGVNLFGGLFTLLVAIAVLRGRAFPRWTGVMAAVGASAYIISSSELLGIPNGEIIPLLGPSVSSLWLAALGVVELLRHSAPQPDALRGAPSLHG